jgi:hypothetical protein
MKINELLKKVEKFGSESIVKFTVEKNLFNKPDGRKLYNNTIRNNVLDRFGIYLWANSGTDVIHYIGMAGKIKNDGSFSNHSLRKKLIASRGKDKNTKKDIQTNDYVKKFMLENKIESLDFYIIYSKDGVPPTYMEAILLHEFYKEKNCLPKLNNSF